MRSGRAISGLAVLAAAALVLPGTGQAAYCGQPISRGTGPTVHDALHVLRSAVQLAECVACECDVDNDASTSITDALHVLRASVDDEHPLACSECSLPNIVVFLTDDQREDTLWAMPHVQELLVANGLRFQSAYSTTAECCPFRASFLAGGFCPANTGVKTGTDLNGAMSHFRDGDTLARRLQVAGYATGFVGHYMHGYFPGHVPAGWTSFVANNAAQYVNWNELRNITYGSSTETAGTGEIVPLKNQYLIEFHRDEALRFLEDHVGGPFFLMIASHAPHWPATPAPQDAELFSDFRFNGSWFLEDISDKPQWVKKLASMYTNGPKVGLAIAQLRSLQSTDRLVRDVVETVEANGQGSDTYYFFLSDNGLSWGEHRLAADKGNAYEESVKVPLVVAGPAVVDGVSSRLVSGDLDVPATILDLAGQPVPGDGISLVQFLRGGGRRWRDSLLLENYGYLETPRLGVGPLWSALRIEDDSGSWKYVEYATGEGELYDLLQDPHETENLFDNELYAGNRFDFAQTLHGARGLAILTRELEPMTVATPFQQTLQTWGGKQPLAFDVVDGALPPGITLIGDTLIGVPLLAGKSTFTIRVTDDGLARHSLEPQTFRRVYTVDVAP